MIDAFFTRLSRFVELLLGVALVFAVALNFFNVVRRYLFDTAIGWADEIQIYIMIWTAFLGAVVCTWRNIHLRMDMLLKRLAPGVQKAVRLGELVTLAVLAGFVTYHSGLYTRQMHALGKLTDVAQIPAWIPHLAVPAGFAVILVISLIRLARFFGKGAAADPAAAGEERAP